LYQRATKEPLGGQAGTLFRLTVRETRYSGRSLLECLVDERYRVGDWGAMQKRSHSDSW
jgi:hypothetical protein